LINSTSSGVPPSFHYVFLSAQYPPTKNVTRLRPEFPAAPPSTAFLLLHLNSLCLSSLDLLWAYYSENPSLVTEITVLRFSRNALTHRTVFMHVLGDKRPFFSPSPPQIFSPPSFFGLNMAAKTWMTSWLIFRPVFAPHFLRVVYPPWKNLICLLNVIIYTRSRGLPRPSWTQSHLLHLLF